MIREPIKQQTVVAQVMDEIRNLIASGAYGPGDKIPTEKELAERFGVGRSSIREAIKIFNYLGVLESRAAIGTVVQERSSISTEALTWSLLLGKDELDDIIDLRGSIELWSLLTLIGLRPTEGEVWTKAITDLENAVREMEKAAVENRREDLIINDYRFHMTIIESAGKPLFSSIYQTLRSFLEAEIRQSQDDYTDPKQIPEEHRAILESIKHGEAASALTTYTAHIENIKNRIQNQKG